MTRQKRTPGPDAATDRGHVGGAHVPAPHTALHTAPTAAAHAVTEGDATATRQALASAAAALGLTLGDRALDRLLEYLALLQRWNATYNLTAVRDPRAMLAQHLVDCLAVVPALERQLAGRPGTTPTTRPVRVLDVGSGGGLPGVVLAIADERLQVTCVDTVGKKSAFVRQVAGQLALPTLQAVHARVEALPVAARGTGFDIVTSRAFSSLADFTRLTADLLVPGGVWMAMKGKPPEDEIAALPARVEVFHVERLQVPGLAADRCLVWMRPRPTAASA